ncbi:hypothetical protein F4827_007094, partial [Paraburkholderia bannensis]
MQEPLDGRNVVNRLFSAAYEGSLEELYVPRVKADAETDRVRSSFKADVRLPVLCVFGRSGIGKSGSGRLACVDSSNEEVAAPHQLAAADSAEKNDQDLKFVRMEYLGRYDEPDIDFQACLERLWVAQERSRKCAVVDHFRLPEGGYLPLEGVMNFRPDLVPWRDEKTQTLPNGRIGRRV